MWANKYTVSTVRTVDNFKVKLNWAHQIFPNEEEKIILVSGGRRVVLAFKEEVSDKEVGPVRGAVGGHDGADLAIAPSVFASAKRDLFQERFKAHDEVVDGEPLIPFVMSSMSVNKASWKKANVIVRVSLSK